MVARTISARRKGATPRLGLTRDSSFFDWTTNYLRATPRRQGDRLRASLAAAAVSARAGDQIGRERRLDLVLDDRPLQEDLGGVVGRGVGLEDLLCPGSMMKPPGRRLGRRRIAPSSIVRTERQCAGARRRARLAAARARPPRDPRRSSPRRWPDGA